MRQITDVEQLEVGKSYWCDNQVCRANYDKELEFVSGLLMTRITTENVFGPIPSADELQSLVRDAEMHMETICLERRLKEARKQNAVLREALENSTSLLDKLFSRLPGGSRDQTEIYGQIQDNLAALKAAEREE